MRRNVRADRLKKGDRLFFTLETVERTFTDAMTKLGYINVLLRKGNKERVGVYKEHRKISLIGD